MNTFAGFSLILKELRLMHRQLAYRFILMFALSTVLVTFSGVTCGLILYLALHHAGLLL